MIRIYPFTSPCNSKLALFLWERSTRVASRMAEPAIAAGDDGRVALFRAVIGQNLRFAPDILSARPDVDAYEAKWRESASVNAEGYSFFGSEFCGGKKERRNAAWTMPGLFSNGPIIQTDPLGPGRSNKGDRQRG